MGGSSSTPTDNTPHRLFEMRAEARRNHVTGRGVPQTLCVDRPSKPRHIYADFLVNHLMHPSEQKLANPANAFQVAMIRVDDPNNSQVMTDTRRFQGENHTEADLIRDAECSASSQLDRPGSHVYLFTENSPCVRRRNRENSCMQLIIDFAREHPNSTVDVGFQRPYGSRFTNDSRRMGDFIADLRVYNHTIGASEPNIPINLHFHRMNVTSNETSHVHDGL